MPTRGRHRRARRGAGERRAVEGEGRSAAPQRPGDQVGLVEGLERVVREHVVAHGGRCGAVERVEQLPERHRRRLVVVRVLAATGVGDDERRRWRRDDRSSSNSWRSSAACRARRSSVTSRQDVVAVDGLEPREDPVVEARPGTPPGAAPTASAPSCRPSASRCGSWSASDVRAAGGGAGAPYVGVAERVLGVADAAEERHRAIELRDRHDVVEPRRRQAVDRPAEGDRPVGDRRGRRG